MLRELLIKNARIPEGKSYRETDIFIRNGQIEHMDNGFNIACTDCMDASGLIALPGFIDLHTHGGIGIDINNADEAGIRKLCEFFAAQGVTGFLPTVMTDSQDNMLRTIRRIRNVAQSEYSGARILGIHLEGPFLSLDFRGAQPEDYIIIGTIDNYKVFEEAAGGLIKYLTVASENNARIDELIEYASGKGTVTALGHTGGAYESCIRCIEKGAKSITHTFNAMAPLHQHRPSIIGAALENDDVFCEFICDGFHLHPAIVRLLVKIKGIDRVIGVTDSIMAAGLPDGSYRLGANAVVVKDGDAMLADGSARAGSTLTMLNAFKNFMHFTGLVPSECIKAFSSNPARLLGLNRKGKLDTGYDADIILLDNEGNIIYTVISGKI